MPDYYNEKFEKRYQKYQEKNKKLTYEQVIKDVNMNLDLTPYEDTQEAKYQNTEKVLVNKYYYLSKDYVPKDLETISKRYVIRKTKQIRTCYSCCKACKRNSRYIYG